MWQKIKINKRSTMMDFLDEASLKTLQADFHHEYTAVFLEKKSNVKEIV